VNLAGPFSAAFVPMLALSLIPQCALVVLRTSLAVRTLSHDLRLAVTYFFWSRDFGRSRQVQCLPIFSHYTVCPTTSNYRDIPLIKLIFSLLPPSSQPLLANLKDGVHSSWPVECLVVQFDILLCIRTGEITYKQIEANNSW